MVNLRHLDKKIWRDLNAMKGQVLTLGFVVLCGVTLFFSSRSTYTTLVNAQTRFNTEHRLADVFSDFKRAPLSTIKQVQSLEGVIRAEPRLRTSVVLNMPNQDEPAMAEVLSLSKTWMSDLNKLYFFEGSEPAADNEVVVHEAFAKSHQLKRGSQFSALIQGFYQTLTVSGIATSPEYVYALNPVLPLPDNAHYGVMWMREEALSRMMDISGSFNSLVVQTDPIASQEKIKADIDFIFKPYGSLGSYTKEKQLSNMMVTDEIRQQRSTSVFMPTVFLLIAAFLLHIVISRWISMQRTQIGALKACGFYNREIILHYIKLISVIMLVGAIPGVFLGALLAEWQTSLYRGFFSFPNIELQMEWISIFVSVAISLCAGLLGGILSLREVSKLPPAEAMRPSAPEIYGRELSFTRQLTHRFDPRSRMALRHFLHRPIRSLLLTVGIGAAMGMMILSLSWRDIIDYIMKGQFSYTQREDVSVYFHEPRPVSVLNELRKYKGVLYVEGYRDVPVKLISLSHSRSSVIQGLSARSKLRILNDTKFQPIAIGQDGLYLSRYFQNQWGLQVGDTIDIERSDGLVGRFQLRVSGFVDDILGVQAYLPVEQLWGLLNEEPSYTSASLQLDTRQLLFVYNELKKTPQIAGISMKTAMYKSFQETMANMITTFTLILIVFATSIAIGIVYNAIRVQLSERSWELAGLRVLGFTSTEVFQILSLETFFAFVLAALPGVLMGYGLAYLSVQMIHSETMKFPVVIYPQTYAFSVMILLFAFVVSLISVYLMVMKLPLVEALKARES